MVSAEATSSPDTPVESSSIDSRTRKIALLVSIAAFAFFLASFPARNGDIYSHLAQGKQLAAGHFTFGDAANPHWLYDLAVFGSHSVMGDNGLVFLKALASAAIGLLLLLASRTGRPWGVPVFCCSLAILAMGIRLLLQPATVSCLMLAACIYLESRFQRDNRHSRFPLAAFCLIFAVWSNVDRWFVLGLATIALFQIGQWMDGARTKRQEGNSAYPQVTFPRMLVILFALAGACLFNPAHILAFSIPEELSRGAENVHSPFQRAYRTSIGDSPAGWAYFCLLSLGILSFAGSLSRWHWRWFLPWLGLALLSTFEARAIPFFAVVAGPVIAWNLQGYFAGDGNRVRRPSRFLSAVTRLSPVALLFVQIALAWPGWLQAPPYQPRRWAIETAPSLKQGAATSRRWLRDGNLGLHPKALHLSTESARTFDWFCPGESEILNPKTASIVFGETDESENWLRTRGITYFVAYDPDRGRMVAALVQFLADPEQWPLLYIEGDLAVFGWRDSNAPNSYRGLELNLDRLAFHPLASNRAPKNRPSREPEARQWWEAFWKPLPVRQIERDEAALLLLMAESQRTIAPIRHQMTWQTSQLAGIAAVGGGWNFQPRFVQNRDDSPPAYLYLAIRAARRSLSANPDDALAYMILGDCYMRLLGNTRERVWSMRMRELGDLRRVQAIAALNQAIALNPKLAQAHLNLGELYVELGYRDLALNHQRIYLKLLVEAGPSPGISAEQFREQIGQHEKELDRRTQLVDRLAKSLAAEAPRLRVLDRALKAMQMGLAGKAREILLNSDVAAFGGQGAQLELELLLRTGRVKDVREWADAEQKAQLGVTYHWLRAQAFAASGDYALAEEECGRLANVERGDQALDIREMMSWNIAQSIVDRQFGMGSIPAILWQTNRWIESIPRLSGGARAIQLQADATTLQGLLALEQGDVAGAATAFWEALANNQSE